MDIGFIGVVPEPPEVIDCDNYAVLKDEFTPVPEIVSIKPLIEVENQDQVLVKLVSEAA